MNTRRTFLRGTAATALACTLPRFGGRRASAEERRARTSRHFEVEAVERTTVRVPFRPAPKRAMDRELPHWRYSEIFEVRLKSGHVGLGETLLYYTWGVSNDDDVARVTGKNAVDFLWDDSVGAGLQMALFDAVAKTSEVPVHRLLGRKVHDRTPLSWWNIDTPPEDMASECLEAYRAGYRSYKTKGRPWFDLWEQVAQSVKVVPPEFKIDMDFNDTLLDAERAIPILKELEAYPQIDIYETPIPQRDVQGNRKIREATRVQIALHYGTPPPAVCVREGACDGFVVGGGARRVMEQGDFAGQVDMPFWLQLVGTGLTAAYSLHFGGVLEQARWPAVNCHQLYTHSLLSEPIRLEDGFVRVPDGPGIGYSLDRAAIERFRVDKPKEMPNPPRLVETRWPDGRRMYFASSKGVNFVLRAGIEGKIPFFERGVTTKLYPDDGTDRWRELFDRASNEPVLVEGE